MLKTTLFLISGLINLAIAVLLFVFTFNAAPVSENTHELLNGIDLFSYVLLLFSLTVILNHYKESAFIIYGFYFLILLRIASYIFHLTLIIHALTIVGLLGICCQLYLVFRSSLIHQPEIKNYFKAITFSMIGASVIRMLLPFLVVLLYKSDVYENAVLTHRITIVTNTIPTLFILALLLHFRKVKTEG